MYSHDHLTRVQCIKANAMVAGEQEMEKRLLRFRNHSRLSNWNLHSILAHSVILVLSTMLTLVIGCDAPAIDPGTSATIDDPSNVHTQRRRQLKSSISYLTEDTHLQVSIDYDSALSAPRWKPTDSNPPLAAADAIRIANEAMSRLDMPSTSKAWTLDHIELQELAIPR
ncbi:MAG: hypothetical protein AAF664_14335, partial [Planctomycetota bacterium]